jgi:putative endonuclease
MSRKFTVYVIRSNEGHQYVGSTEDLTKRIRQHNEHLAGWTKRGNGWTLVYSEEYPTLSAARGRERWLKTGVGREFLSAKLSSGS